MVHVAVFVVRLARLPAARENAHPHLNASAVRQTGPAPGDSSRAGPSTADCDVYLCINRSMLISMNTAESVTLGIAVLGAVTGSIATALSVWCWYRHIDGDRMKIRVVPSLGIPIGHAHSPHILMIQVTNLSAFPITIAKVGVLLRGTDKIVICQAATTTDGKSIERRMDARTAMTVVFPHEFITDPEFRAVRCAFVDTACGARFDGSSTALHRMAKAAGR